MCGAGERRENYKLGSASAGVCHWCLEKYPIYVICENQPQCYPLALLPEKSAR